MGVMARNYGELFTLAQFAVHTTQRGLGEMLGVSKRTAQRFATGRMHAGYLPDLARIVAPHNPVLAESIAAEARAIFATMGWPLPPLPPPPSPAGAPSAASAAPPPPVLTPEVALDAVVCAAAEAMDVSPRIARAGLRAALSRAQALGMTAEVLATAATAPDPEPSTARPRPSPAARARRSSGAAGASRAGASGRST
jgi:hypothetical protein